VTALVALSALAALVAVAALPFRSPVNAPANVLAELVNW